jgi:hypothetical protein
MPKQHKPTVLFVNGYSEVWNEIFNFLGGKNLTEYALEDYAPLLLVSKHLSNTLQQNDEFRLWKILYNQDENTTYEFPSMQFLKSERGRSIIRSVEREATQGLLNASDKYTSQCLYILQYTRFEIIQLLDSTNKKVRILGSKLRKLESITNRKHFKDLEWLKLVRDTMLYLANFDFHELFYEIKQAPELKQYLTTDNLMIIHTCNILYNWSERSLWPEQVELLRDREFARNILTNWYVPEQSMKAIMTAHKHDRQLVLEAVSQHTCMKYVSEEYRRDREICKAAVKRIWFLCEHHDFQKYIAHFLSDRSFAKFLLLHDNSYFSYLPGELRIDKELSQIAASYAPWNLD